MKVSSLLNETVIKFAPFEKNVDETTDVVSGVQIDRYFETTDDFIDYVVKDEPNGEITIKLIYPHKNSGQLIEVTWHTMNPSEIAQERRYKRYTDKDENSIFRRMKLKHEMPHDDKYHSYKYELISEEPDAK